MDTLRSVVVGVDFTSCSKAALAEAVRISSWNQASLRAVHVIEGLVLADLEEAVGVSDPRIREHVIEDARAAWKEFAASAAPGATIPLDVRIDHPAEGLVSAAREHRADLLVLGVYGTSSGTTAGAVAAHAVRRSPCRTMLVRPNHAGRFRRVAIAVDFSPTSEEAILAGMRVAAQDDAEVHVLHVYQAPWSRLHYRAATPQATPDYRKQFLDGLQRRLEGFCRPRDAEVRWIKPTFHVLEHRSHGAGIVEFAGSSAADLVVLGTRGRTNLRDLFLGSTAERVVRECPCSVLAVPPGS